MTTTTATATTMAAATMAALLVPSRRAKSERPAKVRLQEARDELQSYLDTLCALSGDQLGEAAEVVTQCCARLEELVARMVRASAAGTTRTPMKGCWQEPPVKDSQQGKKPDNHMHKSTARKLTARSGPRPERSEQGNASSTQADLGKASWRPVNPLTASRKRVKLPDGPRKRTRLTGTPCGRGSGPESEEGEEGEEGEEEQEEQVEEQLENRQCKERWNQGERRVNREGGTAGTAAGEDQAGQGGEGEARAAHLAQSEGDAAAHGKAQAVALRRVNAAGPELLPAADRERRVEIAFPDWEGSDELARYCGSPSPAHREAGWFVVRLTGGDAPESEHASRTRSREPDAAWEGPPAFRHQFHAAAPDLEGAFVVRKEAVPAGDALDRGEAAPLLEEDAEQRVQAFENLIRTKLHFKSDGHRMPVYRTDVGAADTEEANRTGLGLPARSPLGTVPGDLMATLAKPLPGFTSPTAFESLSFGAPFTGHTEEFGTIALSHLYRGRKIWVCVGPEDVGRLEARVEEATRKRPKCGQYLRHFGAWLNVDLLRSWGVRFTVIDQRAGDTVVLLPGTYHQGFCDGYTLAEARNVAFAPWHPGATRNCAHRSQCNPFGLKATRAVQPIQLADLRMVQTDGEAAAAVVDAGEAPGPQAGQAAVDQRPQESQGPLSSAATLLQGLLEDIRASAVLSEDQKVRMEGAVTEDLPEDEKGRCGQLLARARALQIVMQCEVPQGPRTPPVSAPLEPDEQRHQITVWQRAIREVNRETRAQDAIHGLLYASRIATARLGSILQAITKLVSRDLARARRGRSPGGEGQTDRTHAQERVIHYLYQQLQASPQGTRLSENEHKDLCSRGSRFADLVAALGPNAATWLAALPVSRIPAADLKLQFPSLAGHSAVLGQALKPDEVFCTDPTRRKVWSMSRFFAKVASYLRPEIGKAQDEHRERELYDLQLDDTRTFEKWAADVRETWARR